QLAAAERLQPPGFRGTRRYYSQVSGDRSGPPLRSRDRSRGRSAPAFAAPTAARHLQPELARTLAQMARAATARLGLGRRRVRDTRRNFFAGAGDDAWLATAGNGARCLARRPPAAAAARLRAGDGHFDARAGIGGGIDRRGRTARGIPHRIAAGVTGASRRI